MTERPSSAAESAVVDVVVQRQRPAALAHQALRFLQMWLYGSSAACKQERAATEKAPRVRLALCFDESST